MHGQPPPSIVSRHKKRRGDRTRQANRSGEFTIPKSAVNGPAKLSKVSPLAPSDFGVEIGGHSSFRFLDRPRFAHLPHEIRWDLLYAMRRQQKAEEVSRAPR